LLDTSPCGSVPAELIRENFTRFYFCASVSLIFRWRVRSSMEKSFLEPNERAAAARLPFSFLSFLFFRLRAWVPDVVVEVDDALRRLEKKSSIFGGGAGMLLTDCSR
jgi:hypothetical protein